MLMPGGSFVLSLLVSILVAVSATPCMAKKTTANKKTSKGKESSIVTSRYRVIIAKDPFDKERGGSDVGKESNAEEPTEGISENYELYGIIRTGNLRKAFLKEKKAKKNRIRWNRKKSRISRPKFRIVVEGDMIDGWTVKEITPTGIVLSANDRTVKMDVFASQKANRKALKPVAIQTKPDIPPVIKSPAVAAGAAKTTAKAKASPKTPALKPGSASGKLPAGHPAASVPRPRRNPFKRVLKTSTSPGIKTPAAETPDNEAILSPEEITVPPLNLPGK